MGFLSPRIVLAIVHTHRFLNKATNTDTRYTEAHYSSQTSLYRWSYIAKLPPPLQIHVGMTTSMRSQSQE